MHLIEALQVSNILNCNLNNCKLIQYDYGN